MYEVLYVMSPRNVLYLSYLRYNAVYKTRIIHEIFIQNPLRYSDRQQKRLDKVCYWIDNGVI